MLVVTGQKHPSVTTRVSCYATDQTNLVNSEDQRELDWNHSTLELIQRFPLDGTQQRNCSQELQRKSETQTAY